MKKYTYYFANGTKNTIEIEDEWYDILIEMDRADHRKTYNYDRHNIPLSLFDYDGEDFADPDSDIIKKLIRDEKNKLIRKAIETLNPNQRDIVYMYFFEDKSIYEIAKIKGVFHTSIRNCLQRSYQKLKKFL